MLCVQNALRFHGRYPVAVTMNQDPNRREEGIPISKKQPTASNRPLSNQPTPDRPVSNRPLSNQPTPNRAVNNRPVSNQPMPDVPVSRRPVNNQAASGRPVSQRPVNNQAASGRPVSQRPVNQQAAPGRPVSQRPVNQQAAPGRPVSRRPANQQAAPGRPATPDRPVSKYAAPAAPMPDPRSVRRAKKAAAKAERHGLPIFWKLFFSLAAICILTGVIVGSYVFFSVYNVATGDVVIDLNEYQVNQNQTSIIYAYDAKGKLFELQRLHGKVNRIYLSMNEMPEHLKQAFVSLEDKRFYEHHGVDWIRFVAVFIKDHFHTGGSSITQQLVKNITGERDATFVRKFNEIGYALNLENNFNKNQILEAYLNTLYLGEGCYGVKTAAEKYFGKEVSELNLAESACLAAITKAPYGYDPLVNPQNNRERQLDCLNYMLEQEKITQQEYEEAVNYELILTNSKKYKAANPDKAKNQKDEKETIQSFYVDFIIDSLYDQFTNEKGLSKQEATQKIYYGGLKIYAAIDMNIQAQLEKVYVNRKTFPNESGRKVQVQSAMTIMDYRGRVVAICGAAGKKSGNRCLNRASASPRQPGSSIKPISVYGPAIDANIITWSSYYQDKPFAYQGKQWPKNQGGWGSGGNVTVQNALARSLNTVAARICYFDLTCKKSYQYLTEVFKISSANRDHDLAPAPLATGAMYKGITTLEMAAAYATFGNGGKYFKPYCYYKVTNSDGSTIYFDNTLNEGEQAIGEDTAGVMCKLLQTVTTDSRGTGVPYKIDGFQTMAKTGTTTDDYDRWFVGGTPYYVAAVWYGYDLNKSVSNVSGNPAGKIFKAVMNPIHKKLPAKKFEISDKVVERSYCLNSGKLAGRRCYSTAIGYYKAGNLPSTCTRCSYRSSSSSSSKRKSSSGSSGSSSSVEKTTTLSRIIGDLIGGRQEE